MENREQSSVRVLDKALAILDHLSKLERDIDLASLARQISMPKTTLLRLLNTLQMHNFVQQDSQSRRFRLGWALIYLGKAASRGFNLIDFVHPYLERLSRECGETANLVFRDGDQAVYVDQVVSNSIIKGAPAVGTLLGLHCTASGKVLLSCLAEERRDEIIARIELQQKTEKTITDSLRLKAELARINRQGYALDDEETELGGRCVAAAVRNKEGKAVAAISVLGPISRIKKDSITHLSRVVKSTAENASRALGYRPGKA